MARSMTTCGLFSVLLFLLDTNTGIFCSDPGIQRESVFGSYTNGAGLYKRQHLKQIGRMYGE